jgi:hypothetical protein
MPPSLGDCGAKDLHKLAGGGPSNGVGGVVEVKTPDAVEIACRQGPHSEFCTGQNTKY